MVESLVDRHVEVSSAEASASCTATERGCVVEALAQIMVGTPARSVATAENPSQRPNSNPMSFSSCFALFVE